VAGVLTNQLAFNLTPGTEVGVSGTQTPVPVAITYSANVFDGNATWNPGTTSDWGTAANWSDTNGIHAVPGTFVGFDNTDSATFDSTGATTTVNLNGTSPSLKALTFNSASSYTIAPGTGGSLTLKSNTSTATVTDTLGSHTISANVQLASNTTMSVSSPDTLTLSGAISGSGNLTKTGTGTLAVSGVSNSFAGGLNVNQGTANVLVTGSLSGATSVNVGDGVNLATLIANGAVSTTALTVLSGGTLSGTGTVTTGGGGLVAQSGSTLAPGVSAAGLTVDGGSLTLAAGSTLSLSLANSQGTSEPLPADYAKLTLGTGVSVTLAGQLVTTVAGPNNQTDVFVLIVGNNTSTINGLFSNAGGTQIGAGSTYAFNGIYEINYAFDTSLLTSSGMTQSQFEGITGGNSVALLAVPEPNSWSMLAGSLGMALGLQRFRRRRS
jgi:autotransporter-associated beta strand protein